MPTYQITTDKGTYQVDTKTNNQESKSIPQSMSQNNDEVSSDLNNFSNDKSTTKIENKGSLQEQVLENLTQFSKNAASTLPFGSRLVQLGSLMSGKPMSLDDVNEMYKNIGDPNGTIQQVSAMAGQMVPQMIMMTPFLRGANVVSGLASNAVKNSLPNIGGKMAAMAISSPMTRGASALGAYGGTKAVLTGGNGQQIKDDTIDGITQGLIYGGLTTMGAKFMPKQLLGKYAETAGSAVGGAIAGALTSSGGNNAKASALLMGGLAALTPEKRMDFHKFVANNVTPEQFSKYMRTALQISPDDTKTILDNGINEVERVGNMQIPVPNETTGGTDILGPVQVAQKFYQSGILEIRNKLSQKFQDAIKTNAENNPKDINEFVSGLKKQVDSYADPTSPIVRRFNTTYNALQGFEPTTTETEISGTKDQPNVSAPNPRRITISELPKHLQEQVRIQLGHTGDITKMSLNSLHELKQNLYDAVSDKTWRDPGNTTPDERFAKSLGNQIGEYIGNNNKLYQKASKDWSRMKTVQSDIMGLNTNNLGKDWAELAPANKIDMNNKLNGISSYFKNNGVSQYDPYNLLQKYHAYNAISNPDPTSFRNNAPLKILMERAGGVMGGIIGLPFGLHGAAMSGGLGYLTAIHYMRPESYKPILKEITKGKIPNSMTHDESIKMLKDLISK